MIGGLLGRKLGMTQLFAEHGVAVPVTVIQAGPCQVMQVKTKKRDGYDALQIRDILEVRVGEAFVCGAVEEGVIGYVAELAAADRHRPGDCRYALDLLLAAGFTAEAQGACSINLEHVRSAVSETYPGVRWEDLCALGTHSVAVLEGVVQALILEKSPYVSLRCVYDFYSALCGEGSLRPLSYTRVRELAGDLHDGGFMDLQGGGGVGVSGVSLGEMARILRGLEGRRDPAGDGCADAGGDHVGGA